jgi:hypothetical protein
MRRPICPLQVLACRGLFFAVKLACMADLSLVSKGQLASTVERMKGTVKRARETTKAITERSVASALTAGSGYAVGVAKNKFGEGGKLLIPGTSVEADLAVGVVLSMAGVMGMAGDKSPELLAVGNGILAGHLAVAGYLHGLPGEGR